MDIRRTLLTVAALAVVLAVLVWGYRFIDTQSTIEQKPAAELSLGEAYGLTASAIGRVEIAYADPELSPVVLERRDGLWWLVEPVAVRAQDSKVERVLRVLDRRIRQRLQDPDGEYGFDSPEVTLMLQAGDVSRRFLFGSRGVSYSLYVQEASDDAPILMESWVLEDIMTTPSDLRDRHLLHFLPADVRVVSIHRRKLRRPITVESADTNGAWKMTSPIEADADAWRISETIRILSGIGVSDVLADNVTDLSPWQLDDPPLMVRFGFEDGSEQVLRIMERPTREDRIVVALDGSRSVYSLTSDFLTSIPRSAFEWRDRRVVKFQRTSTTRIDVEADGDIRYSLARRREGGEAVWYLVEPRVIAADGAYVDQVLYDLDALEATQIISIDGTGAPTHGMGTPRLTIRLHDRPDASEAKTLRFGRAMADGVAVRMSGSDNVAFVPVSALQPWSQGLTAFRSKRPFVFDAERVRRVEVRRPEAVLAFVRQPGGWRIADPIVETMQTRVVDTLLADLRDLRVDAFLSTPPYPSDSGLRKPQLTISLLFGDISWRAIRFGTTEDGLTFGQIDGDPDVFVVPKSRVDRVSPTLEDVRSP